MRTLLRVLPIAGLFLFASLPAALAQDSTALPGSGPLGGADSPPTSTGDTGTSEAAPPPPRPTAWGGREVWRGVRAMGMADVFAGGGGGNSALYHNPAGIGIAPVYALETGYRRTGSDGLNAFGVSMVDAKTNPYLAAGVGYSVTFGDGTGDALPGVRDQNLRLAIAVPVIPRRVAFGGGARYVNYLRGVKLETEEERFRYSGLLWDVGAVAAFTPNFSVGASFNNLGSVSDLQVPRLLRVGAAAFIGPAHVELEYEGDLDSREDWTSSWGGALEVTIDTTPIRVGYKRDGVREGNVLGAGFGLRSERGGVDVGFQIDPSDSTFWEIALSFSGYF